MTNKEILYESIKKAVINGYLKPGVTTHFYHPLNRTCQNEAHWYYENDSFYQIIFSHHFAKAFWGEEYVCSFCGLNRNNPDCCGEEWGKYQDYSWEFYLKEMILEEEPLKYLENFLC